MGFLAVLVVIALAALAAVAASAIGRTWGPALLALAFIAMGLLLLFAGLVGLGPLIGFGYLLAGFVELAAASAFWEERASRGGPALRWRVTSSVVGLAGSALLLLLLYALVAFLSWLRAIS